MIGSTELAAILVLALLLLGPKELSEIARAVGTLNHEARKLLEYAPDERKAG